MNLQQRIDLFAGLGNYLKKNPSGWEEAKRKAAAANNWFTEAFIQIAADNIINRFLQKELLSEWVSRYPSIGSGPSRKIGLVMAGNIPLVGFHDLLAVIMCGHRLTAKLSSKDDVLMRFITDTLFEMAPELSKEIEITDNLKGCDAYIATGSNQSARYFDYYFAKYPHIIRSNKTSAAILTGKETTEELALLADDIHLFFGLGCRNVTKVFVPENYDFIPLLQSFDRYAYLREMHKYANNYDYQLSILLLNKQHYMTNGTTLVTQHDSLFSPIGVLYYDYYANKEELSSELTQNPGLQCLVGHGFVPFGEAQKPGLTAYADGVDTMQFLTELH